MCCARKSRQNNADKGVAGQGIQGQTVIISNPQQGYEQPLYGQQYPAQQPYGYLPDPSYGSSEDTKLNLTQPIL